MPEHEAARDPADAENPFAVPDREFFPGGDRRTHLEQLRHLSQWSRRVLLVTGPRDVGKSTLYRQLSSSLEPRAKAARINGALTNGVRDVLYAMVQGFGLAAPADAPLELLEDVIVEHALAQERSERFCATLVDDADMLENRALERLLAIAQRAPLRLVLFGEVRLVPAVERLARGRDLGWHEIRLTGFDQQDVRSYLAWRFRDRAEGRVLPFTEAHVRDIARLSEGLPGRVDQMANVLLAKIRSGDAAGIARGFPARHGILLVVLVVSLAAAYLLWPARDGMVELAGPERVAVPPPGQDRPAPESGPPPAAESRSEPDAAEAQPASASQAASAGRPETARAPERQDVPELQAVRLPVARISAPAPGAAAAGEEQPSAQPAAVSAAGPSPASPPAAVPEQVQAPADSPASPAPQRAPAEPAGPKGPDWIRRQPATAYTLQLVSLSTAVRAREYLAAQERPERFATYELERGGATLHVVLMGSYPDRAAAEQAARQLPAAVGRVEPWIRTFGQVQAAMAGTP